MNIWIRLLLYSKAAESSSSSVPKAQSPAQLSLCWQSSSPQYAAQQN